MDTSAKLSSAVPRFEPMPMSDSQLEPSNSIMTLSLRIRLRAFTSWSVLVAILIALVDVQTASAHVTISPAVVRPSVYQEFVVDVPTEKTAPTIAIRVEFPAGLRV